MFASINCICISTLIESPNDNTGKHFYKAFDVLSVLFQDVDFEKITQNSAFFLALSGNAQTLGFYENHQSFT
jgi:hypothetical protein